MRSAIHSLTFLATLSAAVSGAIQVVEGSDASDASRAISAIAVNQEVVELQAAEDGPLTVVAFLGTECPLARLYGPRLSELSESFSTRGVTVIGINSNRQDSVGESRDYVSEYEISFPIVRDEGNVIADAYEAVRTPEVFLLNSKLEVLYHGRVDDQYEPGITRNAPTREDLRVAIEESLAGQPVTTPQTEPVGCYIGKIRRASPATTSRDSGITFTKQVSRVLQRNCIECHRKGDIGPFALEEYDEVVGWADTILEVVDNGRMPPWHADPDIGHFRNARDMAQSDRQILKDWVAAGTPHGDVVDLPEPMEYLVGWQLEKEPDSILPMRDRPFEVPAEGVVEYQYFVVDPGFEEDMWVRAAQVLPGNRSVVHHGIVFVRPPDGARFRGVGWLTAYVPGQRLFALPPGRARLIPAGSRFVFQMHYTPTGKPQSDLSSVGIVFADPEDVTHEVFTIAGLDQSFEIPPGEPAWEVSAAVEQMPKNSELLAVMPHMHFRGKSFKLYATEQGKQETLLSVPKYDFNWQHVYLLQDPIPLHNMENLQFTATFDNSARNPFNPDPEEWVTWGDQTWQEMAVTFFEVSEPLETTSSDAQPSEVAWRTNERKVESFVDEFFQRLDQNGDGLVVPAETPRGVRAWSFDRFDRDGDGQATRAEVRALAETKFRLRAENGQ